jgi:ABC-2 type transport system permease protein
MSRIMLVAENEFSLTIKNPIVLVSVLLLLIISVVSAYGFTHTQEQQVTTSQLSVIMGCISGNIWIISNIFIILSVCLGVFAIADERSGGRLNVLISKPLYRRDMILGKFIGLSGFLLIVISLTLAILVAAAFIIYPMPAGSLIEIFERTASLVVSLFLFGTIMMGISMMIATIFKNMALVLTIAATILYVQWWTPLFGLLGSLSVLEPLGLTLYYSWGNVDNNFIFTTSSAYMTWFSVVYPYFLLLTIEAILVILIDSVLFNREEA